MIRVLVASFIQRSLGGGVRVPGTLVLRRRNSGPGKPHEPFCNLEASDSKKITVSVSDKAKKPGASNNDKNNPCVEKPKFSDSDKAKKPGVSNSDKKNPCLEKPAVSDTGNAKKPGVSNNDKKNPCVEKPTFSDSDKAKKPGVSNSDKKNPCLEKPTVSDTGNAKKPGVSNRDKKNPCVEKPTVSDSGKAKKPGVSNSDKKNPCLEKPTVSDTGNAKKPGVSNSDKKNPCVEKPTVSESDKAKKPGVSNNDKKNPCMEKPTVSDSDKAKKPGVSNSDKKNPCVRKPTISDSDKAKKPGVSNNDQKNPCVEKPTGSDSGKAKKPGVSNNDKKNPCMEKPTVSDSDKAKKPGVSNSDKKNPCVEKSTVSDSGKAKKPGVSNSDKKNPCVKKPTVSDSDKSKKPGVSNSDKKNPCVETPTFSDSDKAKKPGVSNSDKKNPCLEKPTISDSDKAKKPGVSNSDKKNPCLEKPTIFDSDKAKKPGVSNNDKKNPCVEKPTVSDSDKAKKPGVSNSDKKNPCLEKPTVSDSGKNHVPSKKPGASNSDKKNPCVEKPTVSDSDKAKKPKVSKYDKNISCSEKPIVSDYVKPPSKEAYQTFSVNKSLSSPNGFPIPPAVKESLHTVKSFAFNVVKEIFGPGKPKAHDTDPLADGERPDRYPETILVEKEEVIRFCVDALVKSHVKEDFAAQVADVLVFADCRGKSYYGLRALSRYTQALEKGTLDGDVCPKVLKENRSTAWVDGQNGLGPIIGNFCVRLALDKARITGFSLVSVKNSNDIGVCSWYTQEALRRGMLGLCLTNTSPLLVPTNAKTAVLGANPLAMAAPGRSCDNLEVETSLSQGSLQRVEELTFRKKALPDGWAVGPGGEPTTDPVLTLQSKRLYPLGGRLGGHKGYGLSLMVECLCGILSDSLYGSYIRPWDSLECEAQLGQCFMIINPVFFAPGYQQRLSCLLTTLRGTTPINCGERVMTPGDYARQLTKKVDEEGGIRYLGQTIKEADDLAKELGISPLEQKM